MKNFKYKEKILRLMWSSDPLRENQIKNEFDLIVNQISFSFKFLFVSQDIVINILTMFPFVVCHFTFEKYYANIFKTFLRTVFVGYLD